MSTLKQQFKDIMKTEQLLKFKFIEDIFYYDGPLISFALTEDNTPVLEIWCGLNREENYNLFAYAFLREEDLHPFLHADKSYFNVLKNCSEIILFKYKDKAYDFTVISSLEFLENYGLTEESSFAIELIELRKSLDAFYTKESL